MPGLFVTATGTEVGKTFVSAGLIRAARRASLPVEAVKPVLTGYHDAAAAESDAGLLLAALGRSAEPAAVAAIAPWRYAAPLSPDMAASAEGSAPPRLDEVAAFCRGMLDEDHLTLVEGIGGVMVPLDWRHTVLDLMAELALPILVVVPTVLGAISHALTALAALAGRGLVPVALVLNESEGGTVPPEAMRGTLRAFHPDVPISILPRHPEEHAFDALFSSLRPRLFPEDRPSRAGRSAP